MKICHLYFGASLWEHISSVLSSFGQKEAVEINEVAHLNDADAYIVEIPETNKIIAAKLRTLFSQKQDPLIYFLIPENYNLMFFQLTYLLESKGIFSQKQESSAIVKKITDDIKVQESKKIQRALGIASLKKDCLLIYNNRRLESVSPSIVELFQAPDEEVFIKQILPIIDTSELMQSDCVVEQEIHDYIGGSSQYKISSFSIGVQKILYFSVAETECDGKEMSFISSRMSFIELLKERVLHRDIENYDLSVVTINMLNMQKLEDDLEIVELEDMLFELLNFMDGLLDKKVMLAQYERDFYTVLFQDIYFKEVETLANDFHTQVLQYVSEQTYKPLISVHSVNLKDIEFSEMLEILDNIENNNLTPEQKTCEYIVQSDQTSSNFTEKDLLDRAFGKQSPIKVLNIYNGLVINTPAKILQVSHDAIKISFEQLQGIVINMEKSTVMQSSTFSQDIGAKVKQIDLAKRVAILEDFRFLHSNANSRKYARVTTSSKIPVSINLNKQTINGVILDLSIKSVAVLVRFSQKVNELKSQDISIVFNIPTKRNEAGYEQLRLGANVIAVTPEDEDHNCKVICDFDDESNNESLLLEYVYERQKQLIIELKKIAALHNSKSSND